MASDRKKIIERIRKLLTLAENKGATQAEATAAALAAQRLMAQNDVEEWEVHAEDADPIEGIESKHSPRRWRWHLAEVIAPAFRCRYHQQRSWGCGKYLYKMCFYGYKTDAMAAALTFDYLYKLGNRLGRRFTKGAPRGTFNAYVLGFVEGVRLELEKQCEALMIVTPPKVNDSYEAEFNDLEVANCDLELNRGIDAHIAYRMGEKDGNEAVRSRRMDESEVEHVSDAPALVGA